MSYPQVAKKPQQAGIEFRYEDVMSRGVAKGVVGMKNVLKTVLATLLAVAVAVGLTACGGSNKQAVPPITTSPSPTATAPAWQAKFTAAQIADYNAALTAYDQIQEREAPIWANPEKYTAAEANAIFKQDWFDITVPANQFTTYVQNGLKETGTPKVLSSQLASEKPNAAYQDIVISQCVDGSDTHATQHGRPLPNPKASIRGIRYLEFLKSEAGRISLFRISSGPEKC